MGTPRDNSERRGDSADDAAPEAPVRAHAVSSPLDRYRAAAMSRGTHCGGASDIGRIRVRNEDAYWLSDDGCVLAIADGLGGLPAGDIASALAVAAIEDFFHVPVPAGEGAGSASAPGSRASSDEELRALAAEAAAFAQKTVLDASSRMPELNGMATTLVLALLREDRAVVLHVGDSRALLWRGGRVVRETMDQNGAGELLRTGVITAEEARHHPSRHMVREVLGMREGYQAECEIWPLERGDVLLLLTDGVTEALAENEISRLLETRPSAVSAASSLVSTAVVESGHDNSTAVVRYVT